MDNNPVQPTAGSAGLGWTGCLCHRRDLKTGQRESRDHYLCNAGRLLARYRQFFSVAVLDSTSANSLGYDRH